MVKTNEMCTAPMAIIYISVINKVKNGSIKERKYKNKTSVSESFGIFWSEFWGDSGFKTCLRSEQVNRGQLLLI